MTKQMSINHFIHPEHPLILYKGERKPWNSFACLVCKLRFSEYLKKHQSEKQKSHLYVYGCRECRIIIHLKCSKLPQWLSHPFHPHHYLSLYHTDSQKEEQLRCNACAIYIGKELYVYHCAECNFNLDIQCIELKPLNDAQLKLQKIMHQHPIFVCSQPTNFQSACTFCCNTFSKTDLIYVCVDCKVFLHESCVFPKEIMHPFHLEHPLVLVKTYASPFEIIGNHFCNACSSQAFDYFTCPEPQCKFFLDLSCISLIPIWKSCEYDQQLQNLPYKHPHPLIQCHPMRNQPHCAGCDSPIKDFVYVCLDCGILLDKSCIQLLPQIITNPFHPIHPLNLETKNKGTMMDCPACHRGRASSWYVCKECNFQLDTRCAASTKPYAVVNSRMHGHPLSFLIKRPKHFWHELCVTCRKPCKKYFFNCLECNFCIHLECCPSLPRVIKDDCHCDPLIFCDSQIKDASDEDSDGEFYCHACEDLRDLDDPAYYCQECHFVAHLQCVFTAILHGMEAESTSSPTSSKPIEFTRSTI